MPLVALVVCTVALWVKMNFIARDLLAQMKLMERTMQDSEQKKQMEQIARLIKRRQAK